MSTTTFNSAKGLILALGAVIILLTLHHAYIHNGTLFDDHDYYNAFFNLIKSHEGIIVMLLLVMTGIAVVFI